MMRGVLASKLSHRVKSADLRSSGCPWISLPIYSFLHQIHNVESPFQSYHLYVSLNNAVQPPPPQSDLGLNASERSLYLCAVLFLISSNRGVSQLN